MLSAEKRGIFLNNFSIRFLGKKSQSKVQECQVMHYSRLVLVQALASMQVVKATSILNGFEMAGFVVSLTEQ